MVSLLEGSLWQEALRLLHLHHRSDLLETHLLPGLLEAQMSQLALFESLHSKFSQHALRLVVVRETKKQKQAAILGNLPNKLDRQIVIIIIIIFQRGLMLRMKKMLTCFRTPAA